MTVERQQQADARSATPSSTEAVASPGGGVERHPGDIVRLAAGGVIALVFGWIARDNRVGSFETELFRVINPLPDLLSPPLFAIMQLGSLGGAVVVVGVAAVLRRRRLAVDLAIGTAVGWVLPQLLQQVIQRSRPAGLFADVAITGAAPAGLFGFPSGHATLAAALATVAAPYLPRSWRRATWGVVWVVAIARVHVGAHLPFDVIGGIALGWAIGSAIHLLRGAPGHRPSPADVVAALKLAGVTATFAAPLTADARASTPFRATTADGTGLFVKFVGREQRDADVLFKLYRYTLYRTLEDEAPFATPKRAVEHEAYVSLLAERVGARVPPLVTAGQAADGSGLVAYELIAGRGLDSLEPEDFDDDFLRRVWQQVAALRTRHIAHRDLRLANLMVDDARQPWLIDFGNGEGAATSRRLAQDVAELLAATAAIVGAERAVAAAADVLGDPALVDAAHLLAPLALSTVTRAAAKGGLLPRLREEISRRSGEQIPVPPPMTRLVVQPKVVLMLVAAAFAVHLLLPQVGELGQTMAALSSASWDWLVAAAACSALTYLAAGLALNGSVAQALPLGRTTLVQVAASFTSRVAPAGLGGLGLNERYLERAGLRRATAVGALGLDAVAGAVVHLGLLGTAVAAVGPAILGPLRLPRGWELLAIVAGIAVVLALVAGVPWTRQRIVGPALASLRELGIVLRRPARAAALFGGSAGVTTAYILTLAACVHAFGSQLSLPTVALVYLVGAAIGSASPTPGGLGVVEAALIAGLHGVGVDTGTAVAAVLSYRLLTFWLPILPGVAIFRYLQRTAVI